jgi:hypothetical protein
MEVQFCVSTCQSPVLGFVLLVVHDLPSFPTLFCPWISSFLFAALSFLLLIRHLITCITTCNFMVPRLYHYCLSMLLFRIKCKNQLEVDTSKSTEYYLKKMSICLKNNNNNKKNPFTYTN